MALELLRRRVADDTERRLAGDVVSAIVSGELDGAERSRVGCSRSGSGTAPASLVLAPPRPLKAAGRGRARPRACATRHPPASPPAPGASRACAPLPARCAATRSCSRSPSACAPRRPPRSATELAGGAGRAVAAGDARRTFHEARCALEARALADGNGDPGRASPPTTTSARSSCCSRSRTTRRCGCSATRSSRPIEEGEGAYGGELMRSLEAFIECNGQWERAARAARTATGTRCATGSGASRSSRAGRWIPRAIASTSGSRCAGAS